MIITSLSLTKIVVGPLSRLVSLRVACLGRLTISFVHHEFVAFGSGMAVQFKLRMTSLFAKSFLFKLLLIVLLILNYLFSLPRLVSLESFDKRALSIVFIESRVYFILRYAYSMFLTKWFLQSRFRPLHLVVILVNPFQLLFCIQSPHHLANTVLFCILSAFVPDLRSFICQHALWFL